MDQTPLENEPTHMITPVDHIYYVWWMVAIRIVCNVGISHLQFGNEASIICFIQYSAQNTQLLQICWAGFRKLQSLLFCFVLFFTKLSTARYQIAEHTHR